jgi:hypothetical protein
MQGHLFGDKEDVVFFVWQGTLDLNQSLDAIKDSRLASLAAVRVESDIVNPSFSSKGVVTTEPVLDVRILNRDKDKIIVELTDYRFRLLAGPPAVRKAFGQPSTLAFLSYWGLSRASMHRTEFIPEWHSYRTRSKPTVEIHSSELDISNPTTKVLRVVAADIFGNRIEQLIKL